MLDTLYRNTTNDSVINPRAIMYKKLTFTFQLYSKNINYSNTNSNSNRI